ncbi:hypothetical protein [Ilyobacter polytropus]|uniref:Uncharacterized protein n=1 Tax=Ilyobacter polytropus (strain ATCC 51220 / DSM 2926 / LMG 16218 / CuHBu1) TaxID=572544 RepID=E3HBE9_ILYPC|nr:hypothetical protein [Ilyobacter polytropus]ADO83764.1 hypothetical protein Ilyop_1993 [Ilyobacter polytropus DSM 2926]
MSVVHFVPKGNLNPIFGVRLCPAFHRLLDIIDDKRGETFIKKALNIQKDRAIKFKGFTDKMGKSGTIVVVYDYFNGSENPKLVVPETSDGYFDFKIYDVDYNKEVDIENLIEKIKRLSV